MVCSDRKSSFGRRKRESPEPEVRDDLLPEYPLHREIIVESSKERSERRRDDKSDSFGEYKWP